MEKKERVVDLRNYFKFLAQKIWVVLLVMSVCTVGLIAYDYRKQNSELSGNGKALLQEIMTQNHDAYYGTGDTDSYTDAEPPEGTYNSAARLYIDFNYSDVEGSNNLDFTEMNNAFEQDAKLIMWSTESLDEVIDELKLHSYKDMEEMTADDLKWMINENFYGAHVMNIVVTDTNPERASQIAQAVIDKFVTKIKAEMKVDSVRIMDEPTRLADKITINQSVSGRKLLKYGLVGFIGGFILIAIIYLVIFLVRDSVWSQMDVEFAGLTFLGDLHQKKEKNQQEKKLAAVLKNSFKDDRKLILTGADRRSGDTEKLATEINDFFPCAFAKNLKDYSDVFELPPEKTRVLIVAGYGKTSVKDLAEAGELLKLAKIECVGAVIQ